MADINTTDFHKYPKYNLDKRGYAIQEILDVASETFGMLYNLEENPADHPSLQKTVGGAENLQNSDGAKILFLDQIDVVPEDGKINLILDTTNPSVVPAAIGNYATDEDIKALFATVPGAGEFTPEESPVIKFSADGTKVIVEGISSEDINRIDLYKYIITTLQNNTNSTYEVFCGQIDIPNLDLAKVGQQRIECITLGDQVNTTDSNPVTLYRLSIGTPQIGSQILTSADGFTTTFNLYLPEPLTSTLLPEHVKIANSKIKLIKVEVDYTKNLDAAIKCTSIDDYIPGDPCELTRTSAIGQAFIAACELPENAISSDNTLKPINLEDYQVIPADYRIISKIKQLNTPSASIVTTPTPIVSVEYNTDGILGDVAFYYSVHAAGETYTEDQLVTGPISLQTGDSIRIKAVSVPIELDGYNYTFSLYNDSEYYEYTVEEAPVEVDFVASNIVLAVNYDPPASECWYKRF